MKTTGREEATRQPRSKLERQIQKTWACVLGVEEAIIGLDDNFFQLGGDSIAAMKVVAEARKAGVGLTVADIFRCPTLEQVAAQAHDLVQSSPEVVAPFSLLDGSSNISSLLRDISLQFHIETSIIEDAYRCTALQEVFCPCREYNQATILNKVSWSCRLTSN